MFFYYHFSFYIIIIILSYTVTHSIFNILSY